jgi:hypothetical protein
VDDIEVDLKVIVWKCIYWIHLAGDAEKWQTVVNTVMNLRVPYKAGLYIE